MAGKPNRTLPVAITARFTARERALIDAAAQLEGATMTELVRQIVLPAVSERVKSVAVEVAEVKARRRAA